MANKDFKPTAADIKDKPADPTDTTSESSKQPDPLDMRIGGPTPGTDALKPVERPLTMHEAVVAKVQAEQDALVNVSNPLSQDEINPTTYRDYLDTKGAPKVGDIVFYILDDGPSMGTARPAIVVATKGSVCELCVFRSADDEGRTSHNIMEVSKSKKDDKELGTYTTEFPTK